MKVAIFGCAHGMLNNVYSEVARYEKDNNVTVDFIIVCGDCQTLRHEDDLKCVSIPDKYKRVGDFPDYYSGRKDVPKLTMFVGGNHEASNYLMSLPYGGWVCKNFYYLGCSNVVNYKGLRIAGISGIYNKHNSTKGRFESLPLDESTKRSIYHTRVLDVFRLQLLAANVSKNPIDIFLSHDWPAKINEHGDTQQLLRFKPFFAEDIRTSQGLGNPLTRPLGYQLKPRHWFAAHLHCKFTAEIKHDQEHSTHFLSLNKIDKGKKYMEIMDIEVATERQDKLQDDDLFYDPEWLAILKKTYDLESDSREDIKYPSINDKKYLMTNEDIESLIDGLGMDMKVPRNFKMSEPVIYDRQDGLPVSTDPERRTFHPNPQTQQFMLKLRLQESACSKNDRNEEKLVINRSLNDSDRPAKKRASQEVELDEDGCLPYCIDKNADF